MKQQNKWTAVVPALEDIFGQMETAADTGVAAGLVVFSDTNDSTMGAGPYPGSSDVSIGFVSAAQQTALDNRLSGMPMNSTPTQAALTGGYGVLEGFQAQAPLQAGGKKVLVLITDGVPTDGCMSTPGATNYSTNPCIELAAQKLAETAPKGPIETFVIGVGNFGGGGGLFGANGIDPGFLGNLAQAGGTGPAKCNPNETTTTSDLCYFEIDGGPAPDAVRGCARRDSRSGPLVHVPDPVDRARADRPDPRERGGQRDDDPPGPERRVDVRRPDDADRHHPPRLRLRDGDGLDHRQGLGRARLRDAGAQVTRLRVGLESIQGDFWICLLLAAEIDLRRIFSKRCGSKNRLSRLSRWSCLFLTDRCPISKDDGFGFRP
jgi:hypothetical protein